MGRHCGPMTWSWQGRCMEREDWLVQFPLHVSWCPCATQLQRHPQDGLKKREMKRLGKARPFPRIYRFWLRKNPGHSILNTSDISAPWQRQDYCCDQVTLTKGNETKQKEFTLVPISISCCHPMFFTHIHTTHKITMQTQHTHHTVKALTRINIPQIHPLILQATGAPHIHSITSLYRQHHSL